MIQNLVYNLCESFTKNIDGVAGIRKTRPPLEEILAPDTFELTLRHGDIYYWTTFYTSAANYLAPEGVIVLKIHVEGSSLIHIPVEDRIINKGEGVVLKSPTSSVTLTKTYSKSSDDYSNNSLIGTDYLITNPGNAYGLGYKQSSGIGFYRLSATGKITANKAYLIIPPTPIYLTQWKIVGNSEVHGQEIWSCGEYNATDGKYHILVQPQGGSIADIALTEPLRKVNDIADSIEFPSDTEGKALVTRNLNTKHYNSLTASRMDSENKLCNLSQILPSDSFIYTESVNTNIIFLCNKLNSYSLYYGRKSDLGIIPFYKGLFIRNASIEQTLEAYQEYLNGLGAIDVIYKLATPTTELVDAPQIQEADSYSMIISQGGKAVSWSEFLYTLNYLLTDSENNLLIDSENYQLTVQS